jgi:hypothetical protein
MLLIVIRFGQLQEILASGFVFDFGREERASNNLKRNTATSSARSGGELKLKAE